MAATIAELMVKIGAQTSDFERAISKSQRSMEKFGSKMQSIGKNLSMTVSAPLSLLGVGAVKAAADFEKMKVSLNTAFQGNQQAAEKAFKTINEFTAKTPFQLEEVMTGFIKLKNMGLDPSMEALTAYGNTASSMGKSLNDMVEAVADAATGEFERLKEFGIRAKSEGNKVAFTFQGVTTTVKKNSEDIEQYLMNIGNTKFAGGIEAQSKTIYGQLSTLQDNIKLLAAEFGNIMLPAVRKITAALGQFASFLSGLSPAAKNVIVAIVGITAAIGPLMVIIGGMVTVFSALLSPVTLVVAGLAALAAGIIYVADNWEAVKERVSDISWWRNALIDMVQFLIEWSPVSLFIKSINELITYLGKDPIPNPFEGLADMMDGLKGETKEFQHEFKSVGETFDSVKGKVLDFFGSFSTGGGAASEAIDQITQDIAEMNLEIDKAIRNNLAGSITEKVASIGLEMPEAPSVQMVRVEPTTDEQQWQSITDIIREKGREWERIVQASLAALGSIGNSVAQIFSNKIERQSQALDQFHEAERERIRNSRMTHEEQQEAMLALDEKVQRRKQALLIKQAKIEKKAALFTAVVNVAQGITQALASASPPVNFILAALVAAAGGVQIAAIASQPLPQFAEGGIVPGTSFSGDKVLSRLNSGEMVLNAGQQSKLFNMINSGNGGGGQPNIIINANVDWLRFDTQYNRFQQRLARTT